MNGNLSDRVDGRRDFRQPSLHCELLRKCLSDSCGQKPVRDVLMYAQFRKLSIYSLAEIRAKTLILDLQ